MKVKKKFCNSLLCRLLMIFGLVLAVQLFCPPMNVEAKTKTITVKNIDQKTAKKVHNQLMKGKAFNIRFKCSEKNFYKKFHKLTKKVAKCTDIGFDVFPICMKDSLYFGVSGGRNPKQSGKYTTFKVNKSDCQEYIYGIKFARREYKDFRTYVDKTQEESEYLLSALNSGTVYVDEVNYKSKEALTEDTKETIADLKELSEYLRKTKLRDLSGAMKARILLEVGSYSKEWGDCSMTYTDGNIDKTTFKFLYQRKARGHVRRFTMVACKICAVFDIGQYDQIKGKSAYAYAGEAVRVKTKTLSGKTRYAIVAVGEFCPYNDYVGFKTWPVDTLYCRRYDKKNLRLVKKIKKKQQLQEIGLLKRRKAVYEYSNGIDLGKELMVYGLDVPKSEW